MSSHRSIPNVDRISNLPDSVICHILSFLSTKQSAATSILSKRWNPLWHSVFTLDFDDQSFTDFHTFRHFVYSGASLRGCKQLKRAGPPSRMGLNFFFIFISSIMVVSF
ncbi:putative F-box domain-containing protein [Medicago truncatula]|uniref:Putative F-box domain-containing protein n=1 Tax=Medicago truncatula TaxID=3880 RepID=A0A396GVN6_MEDTR|nr:putative F-box domain-containing protein [Medicago truncatula]